ncbi:MAG: aminotransferase class III-fold pyridoxal phosphate-dependent enzyme [Rhizobiales bacterium]|nr:aminotransferase class III-fold pyridoxal phosphate-dependent enzyme [Hyphomicrobiales bacterium]
MQFNANSLEEHWMPFSGNRDFKENPRLVVKAEGCYFWDHKGGKLLDGSSALFNVACGHGRTEISEAVYQQLKTNDYTPHFQLGHPGSFQLAREVAKLTPDGINHVFFANSGSEAIDTALKIVMAYNNARGQNARMRMVTRERAYHGVNIGGVSLSGMVRNRDTFPLTMPYVATIRHTWLPENRYTRGQGEHGGVDLANDLERAVQMYGGQTIAAVFVEPIAGSTGCLVPPKGYLERLREICDQHGILLVFDEVITGFGRLGKPFASQAFGVTPDIMTMAKAITNGAQPMGAVAVKDEIYDTVVNKAPEGAIEFFHGYTYSAHPAACAAGLATMEIYNREKLFDRAAELSSYFLDAVFDLRDLKIVTDIRGYGLMAAIDVATEGGKPGARGTKLQKKLFWEGLHIKFTGDAGIIAPPLVVEKSQIDDLVTILRRTLEAETA